MVLKNKLGILFMRGIDVSYFYEGYSHFRTEEL